ncbi:MAG TPA: FtsX-like permease family protein [Feifaniaceae bacterium]|nr:FtsX-like permease family protein [Feifaniaceae bacterium]
MRRHAAWKKNQRREVVQTLGRFLSILMIVAIGVGFFAGLKVTRKAMVDTGDEYLTQNAMYDERLLTSVGIAKDDPEAIAKLAGVKAAEGAQSVDFLALMDDGASPVLAAHSITESINLLSLTAGRMPQADNECVVDAREFTESDIGRVITVAPENDEDTIANFAYSAYTIVGLANSVDYLNMERGTTKLAGGKITGFVYIPLGGFDMDYYTELFVTLEQTAPIFTDAYEDAVDAMEQPLTDELETLANARYHTLVQDALDQISDAENEYNDGYAEYTEEKADAEQELDDAYQQLEDAQEQIRLGWGTIYENEASLASAKSSYEAGLSAYTQGLSDYESQKAASDEAFAAAQSEIDSQRAVLSGALQAAIDAGDAVQIAYYQGLLTTLEGSQSTLDTQKGIADAQFAIAKAQLDDTKTQLDAASQLISEGYAQLSAGKHQLNVAQEQLDEGLADYQDATTEADEKFADAEQELADGKAEIDDAKEELAELEAPECYVLDRSANIGYSCFENDSSVVDGIAKVFPVFFFLVAALVCMTTMARMVEEQRTQIGTLKALGYGNGAIAMKYISYSTAAATIGCVLGFFGGIKLFPWVIWQAYGMLYGFAPLLYVIDWNLFFISLAVSLICSAGVTAVTCRAEMTLMPAELMRPKAPKEGKRVFLERFPLIWNRLSFMKKVSFRNVFRYKQRLFMMVLGIGGCTALLLTGFGVRDSVSNIVTEQFDTIMKYDLGVAFDTPKSESERTQFALDTADVLDDCVFVCSDTLDVPSDEGSKAVNVIATGDLNITTLFDLHYEGESVPYPADGSVVISDKLARVTGVTVGDKITVRVDSTRSVELPVSGIFENYVYYYILMTPATYEATFETECAYKTALATSAGEDVHAAAADLINRYGASNVAVTEDIRDRVDNMMTSMNYIVLLVIVSAAALAMVVLFNLSNINITERIREIATIKVLGFYAPEVGAYVFRENLVLTMLGALAGIPLGIWLHRFVMGQLSFDMVTFKVMIAPLSFAAAIAITFSFTFLVDVLMRRKLGKIDMVESLKAIE